MAPGQGNIQKIAMLPWGIVVAAGEDKCKYFLGCEKILFHSDDNPDRYYWAEITEQRTQTFNI